MRATKDTPCLVQGMPSRHDKAMSNVRVGPPYSQLKDIYLTRIWEFFK
jgi:hypothetical protein